MFIITVSHTQVFKNLFQELTCKLGRSIDRRISIVYMADNRTCSNLSILICKVMNSKVATTIDRTRMLLTTKLVTHTRSIDTFVVTDVTTRFRTHFVNILETFGSVRSMVSISSNFVGFENTVHQTFNLLVIEVRCSFTKELTNFGSGTNTLFTLFKRLIVGNSFGRFIKFRVSKTKELVPNERRKMIHITGIIIIVFLMVKTFKGLFQSRKIKPTFMECIMSILIKIFVIGERFAFHRCGIEVTCHE